MIIRTETASTEKVRTRAEAIASIMRALRADVQEEELYINLFRMNSDVELPYRVMIRKVLDKGGDK